MVEFWERTRSDFNHAWLKNRLIVGIRKAGRVLDGTVRDDSTWTQVEHLLADWPALRADASRVIAEYRQELERRVAGEFKRLTASEQEMATWLGGIAMQRITERHRPDERAAAAAKALEALDIEIARFTGRLSLAQRSGAFETLREPLRVVEAAAVALATALTALAAPGN
jgi:hypothetical protein